MEGGYGQVGESASTAGNSMAPTAKTKTIMTRLLPPNSGKQRSLQREKLSTILMSRLSDHCSEYLGFVPLSEDSPPDIANLTDGGIASYSIHHMGHDIFSSIRGSP